MNARELKRLFRKQTRCSYFRMILQDRNYDPIPLSTMQEYIDGYKCMDDYEYDDEWKCDDIARDFWNFVKIRAKRRFNENALIGLVVFPEHTKLVWGKQLYLNPKSTEIYYTDQDNWETTKPDKKPKWIVM